MKFYRPKLALVLSLLTVALLCPGAWVAAATVCSVSSSAANMDTGVGGTGIDTGHGGTGLQADVGVGGTGIQRDTGTGGTGIVGVITGFGSICVNGTEVEYNAATAVENNGAKGSPNDLKIGQVVEVRAAGHGERVFAQHIAVRDALIGPVTRVDLANGRLEVMHQPVLLDAGTIVGSKQVTTTRPGEFVRVSGFRTSSGVFASRIDTVPSGPVRLTGTVTGGNAARASVGGLNIELRNAQLPASQADVTVVGQWQGNAIRASSVEVLQNNLFAGKTEFLSVQGRIGQRLADGSYQIGSLRVELPQGVRFEGGNSLHTDGLCQIEGRIGPDNRLHAERVLLGDRLPRPDNARGDERIRRGQGEPMRNTSSQNADSQSSQSESASHGSGDSSSNRIERSDSDSHSGRDGGQESETTREQLDKLDRDASERAAKTERDRRDELEKIQREQSKETERLQNDHSGKSD